MAEPSAVPAAPAPVTDADGLVHVTNAAGQVMRVRPEDAAAFQAQGGSVASAEQVSLAREKERLGGIGGMLATGFTSALDTLTLGGASALATEIGGENTAAGIRMAREVNPGANIIGGIAGGLLSPIKIPGGASFAGKVGAAMTEGALFGAGAAVSEAAITQRWDQLGELMAANVGLSSLMAGGGALALHGLGAGIGKLAGGARKTVDDAAAAVAAGGDDAAKAIDSVGEKAFGGASPVATFEQTLASATPAQAARTGAIKAMARAEADAQEAFAKAVVSDTAEGARLRALAQADEGAAVAQVNALHERMTQATRISDEIGSKFSGQQKLATVKRLAQEGVEDGTINHATALESAARAVDEVESLIADIKGKPGEYAKWAGLRNLENKLARARRELADVAGDASGDGVARAFAAADEVKRGLFKEAQRIGGRGIRDGAGIVRFADDAVGRLHKRLWDSYEGAVRPALEDATAWGGIGRAQAEVNAPWARMLDSKRSSKWNQRFTEIRPSSGPTARGTSEYAVSRKSLEDMAKTVLEPSHSDARASMLDWLSTTEAFAEQVAKHASPADAARAAELSKLAQGIRGDLDNIAAIATAKNRYKALVGSETAAKLADLAPGPLKGIISRLGEKYIDPKAHAERLFQAELLQQQAASKVASGFSRIASRARSAAGNVAGMAKRTAGLAADYAPRAIAVASPYVKPDKTAREYQTRIANQRAMARPGAAADLARAAFAPLAPSAPLTVQAAATAAEYAAAYLAGVAPKISPNPAAFRPPAAPTWIEQLAHLDRTKGVDDPLDIVRRLAEGEASALEAQAIRQAFPSIYQGMQDAALETVQRAAESGKELPADDRRALSLALDLPLDELVDPGIMREVQAALVAGNPPTPPQAPTPRSPADAKLVESLKSRTDRIGA